MQSETPTEMTRQMPSRRGINQTWLRLNKKLMIWCLYHSTISNALNIPKHRILHLVDDLTLVWSVLIFLTSTLKFLIYPKRGGVLEQGVDVPLDEFIESVKLNRAHNNGTSECDLKRLDFILVNYFPCINQFASLYYGLVLLSIGTTLVWRIYLRVAGLLAAKRRHKHNRRWGTPLFDAKRELVEFFTNEPVQGNDKQVVGAMMNQFIDYESTMSIDDKGNRLKLTNTDFNHMECSELRPRTYRVPNRSCDFLRDTSRERWRSLALQVDGFVVFLVFTAVPVIGIYFVGLYRANIIFGPLEASWHDDWPPSWLQAQVLALKLYGYLEQAYISTQLSMFFVSANLFNMLLHSDLCYKANQLNADMRQLREHHGKNRLYAPTMKLIKRHQILICAYFDQITQFDEFVSKFSLVAVAMITVGVSFSQSFFLISDGQLRRATLAALFGNWLSFSYLYVLSDHVERKSKPLERAILSILALEERPVMRKEWFRVLHRYFRPNRPKTFTINGRVTVDVLCYSKIILGLLGVSQSINRVFYRPYLNLFAANAGKSSMISNEIGARDEL